MQTHVKILKNVGMKIVKRELMTKTFAEKKEEKEKTQKNANEINSFLFRVNIKKNNFWNGFV